MHAFPILATVPAIVTTRHIDRLTSSVQKRTVAIQLTAQAIEWDDVRLPLDTVTDCSAKPFSDGSYFFYVHTKSRLHALVVTSSPQSFIACFHTLRRDGSIER